PSTPVAANTLAPTRLLPDTVPRPNLPPLARRAHPRRTLVYPQLVGLAPALFSPLAPSAHTLNKWCLPLVHTGCRPLRSPPARRVAPPIFAPALLPPDSLLLRTAESACS